MVQDIDDTINSSTESHPKWMFWKKRRYVVATIAFFGFFNVYALRVNLSIAIVAMTENKTTTLDNGTVIYGPEFDWDSEIQGYILSSFFYGYITTQILGGWISAKIGGKRVFGTGIAVTGALTLLTPWLANVNVYLLLTVRIIEGIFEGVTYPSIHAVWARWAPPLERTRLATLAFSGSYAGTVVAMPLGAYLAESLGWSSIFYFFGSLSLIWFVIWWVVVAESPDEDTRISETELMYIKDSLEHIDPNRRIHHPWKEILKSVPVWAIAVSHLSENWGFYTLLTQLPKFMKDILNFDLGQTGFMSALPYLAMGIVIPIAGYIADWLQEKRILTTTQVRKIFNCGGFLAQTVFMLGAAFVLTPGGTIACLTIAVGLNGFAWSGFSVNYLDVAPQHASILMGLGNTFATLPGIVSPIISGYIVTTPTAEEWQIIFYITSAIYLFGCIFYGTFASGELQPWAINVEDVNRERAIEGHDNRSFQ
jgi:ACS family sodium-dependent inorganic phosphate cotransporter